MISCVSLGWSILIGAGLLGLKSATAPHSDECATPPSMEARKGRHADAESVGEPKRSVPPADNQKLAEDLAKRFRQLRIRDYDIRIRARAGQVTLSGVVADAETVRKVVDAARRDRRIVAVVNELSVGKRERCPLCDLTPSGAIFPSVFLINLCVPALPAGVPLPWSLSLMIRPI